MTSLGLHAVGTEFYHNGAPKRGIGVNHYSLFLDRLMNTGVDPYDWRESLATAKNYGVPFVRTTFGFYDAQHWETYYRLNKAAYYGAIDAIVAECELLGVGIIANLAWGVRTFTGWSFYRYGVAEGPASIANSLSNSFALQEDFVSEFVSRYKNSPAIWAWEFCNEPIYQSGAEFHPAWVPDGSTYGWLNWGSKPGGGNYTAADKLTPGGYERWAQRTRDLFKRNDPHARLVISGDHNGASFFVNARRANSVTADTLSNWSGVDATEYDPAICYINRNYDAVTSHTYPKSTVDGLHFSGSDMTAAQIIAQIKTWADAAGKPMILEEFGATYSGDAVDEVSTDAASEAANFNAIIAAIQSNNVQLSACWNMEGNLSGAAAWMKWKLNSPSRLYQLESIESANAAMQT